MATPEQYPIDNHTQASNAILNELQNCIDKGYIPAGGRVNSFICVTETIDENGKSRVQVLWLDDRVHALLGLLAYGNIVVQMGIGAPPEE